MKLTWISQRWIGLLICILAVHVFAGCAQKGIDPWEKWNRSCYDFNEGLDKAVIKPMADGYVKGVPKPVRQCISNGFDNLEYGNVILNGFLQGKWEQGLSDSGRMLVNTTVGVAGIFDVATPMGLVEHDTDFGITLGKWGVEPGPYLVLPLFGPSTVRDTARIPAGMVTNPVFWIDPPWYVTVPLNVLDVVDLRSRYEKMFKFRNDVALDPYVFTRDAFLQRRQSEIYEGRTPPAERRIFDEEEEPSTGPATRGAIPPATRPGEPRP